MVGLNTELTKEYNLIATAAENDPNKQCLLANPTTGVCPSNAFQDEVTSNGTYLQQWDYLAGANQLWQITALQYYNVVNRLSGAALDLTGTSSADDAAIQQWALDGYPQQQWQLVTADSGTSRS